MNITDEFTTTMSLHPVLTAVALNCSSSNILSSEEDLLCKITQLVYEVAIIFGIAFCFIMLEWSRLAIKLIGWSRWAERNKLVTPLCCCALILWVSVVYFLGLFLIIKFGAARIQAIRDISPWN